ncbi:MAG: HAMP domain-containing protein [Spirochaetes bacterium]|nr:HAMP domain-containing protein [Spirochaetota bacterium]
MFKRMCIRTRIVVSMVAILLFYTGGILILESRMEKKLSGIQFEQSPVLPYNSFLSTVLFGDNRTGLMMGGNYAVFNGEEGIDEFATLVHSMRYQVLMVFAFFIVTGVLLAMFIARGISKPIMDLARASGGILRRDAGARLEPPRCTELRVLAESFNSMQKELREYDEEKSRAEGVEITKQLAAGIAHEIKNPINTVGLIADYIQTNLSPDDPEKRYEFYKLSENMKGELKRINRIVEGFLRLTRPDAFTFETEDVNGIIRESVSVLEPEIVKNNITLSLKLDDTVPPVRADKEKLNQMFSNLIINAVEAMPRGGDIEVSSGKLDGKMVKVEILDTGIGIPKEDRNKIFNPYYTTKKQGFGLGLSLIHNIVINHMGKINVYSEKGKGARFEILLPVDSSDE